MTHLKFSQPIPALWWRLQMKPGKGLILWLLGVLLGLPTLAGAEPAQVHSSQPARPAKTLKLQEIWRVGGEEDNHLYGLMIEAVSDEAGKVYLMDQQLCEVTVISPEGRYLQTLGRQGDGPGELRAPQGLAFMSDGTLGIAEQFPGKFVKLTLTGEPAGTVTLGGGEEAQTGYTYIAGCVERGGTILVGGQFSAPIENGQSRNAFVASISQAGTELVRHKDNTVLLDFQKAHFVEREMVPSFMVAYAVGPDGRIYTIQDRGAYAIEVFNPDGSLDRVITREFENLKQDKRELRRINALFEVQARNLPFDITWEVEKYEQTISGLHVAADGTLWVQHSRSGHQQPEGVLMTYDLFGPDGVWLQEVSVACAGNPAHDGLIFLDDGRVLLVKGLVLARLTATGSQGAVFGEEDETGPMEVICCRMVP